MQVENPSSKNLHLPPDSEPRKHHKSIPTLQKGQQGHLKTWASWTNYVERLGGLALSKCERTSIPEAGPRETPRQASRGRCSPVGCCPGTKRCPHLSALALLRGYREDVRCKRPSVT